MGNRHHAFKANPIGSELTDEVDQLAKLEPGWDGHEGIAPNSTSLIASKLIIRAADTLGFKPDGVSPLPEGGICLFYDHPTAYADISCFDDGEIWAVTNAVGGKAESWQLSEDIQDACIALRKIRDFLSDHAGELVAA